MSYLCLVYDIIWRNLGTAFGVQAEVPTELEEAELRRISSPKPKFTDERIPCFIISALLVVHLFNSDQYKKMIRRRYRNCILLYLV